MKPFNPSKEWKAVQLKGERQQIFFVIRIFACIFAAGATLFSYIDKQNELTELRMAIPILAKEVKYLQEENIRLTYEIERFESPIHLMELMRKPEFGHLKYPYLPNEIFLPQGAPLIETLPTESFSDQKREI